MESLFDLVGGLPVHPLVVHSVAVLVPLAALGLVVAVVNKSFRTRFGGALLIILAVSVPLAFIAKESGEALSDRIGITEQHEELGENFPVWVIALFVIAAAWYFVARRDGRVLLRRILGGAVLFTAIQITIMTFLVGHSGAEATWGNITSPVAKPSATESAQPGTVTTDPAVWTADEVAQHATVDDCWTVIDGAVYDVTPFVSRHPGGASAISTICGGDGTSLFAGQHGSASAPNAQLDSLKIGLVTAP